MEEKINFDIEKAIPRLREMVAPLPPAALFALYEQGYTSLFEQLVACILSIRTYDEVTVPVAVKLFAKARTPAALAALSRDSLAELIADSSYAYTKAEQLKILSEYTVEAYNGQLPADFSVLTSFKGVGPKCAGLALGIAAAQPYIGVDIHVHRVSNRWGYVQANTAEKTLVQLQEKLPQKYWVEINRLLVPFGKHICTRQLPRCSTCLLEPMCRQLGVKKHR